MYGDGAHVGTALLAGIYVKRLELDLNGLIFHGNSANSSSEDAMKFRQVISRIRPYIGSRLGSNLDA